MLVLESLFYLSGEYYIKTNTDSKPGLSLSAHGQKALDYVLQNNLPQPIFNNFDIGSYIIYRGFPKYKVFVDGRPEAYPASFFQKVYIPMQENQERFAQIDKEINFKTIIFSHTDQTPWGKSFLFDIVKNPDWKIVYLDDFIIVLIKDNENSDLRLKDVNLDLLNPSQYQFNEYMPYLRISFFLLNTNHIPTAKLFAQKALEIAPDNPFSNLMMANILYLEKNSMISPKIQIYLEKSKNQIWW